MRRLLLAMLLSTSLMAQTAELDSYQVSLIKTPVERVFEGKVEAIASATVSAETSGRVDKIFVDVGDHVPAGATILSLVGIDQQASLNQTEAALAEALSSRSAESKQYTRVKALYERQLLSKANFDEAKARFDSASARVASAEAALKKAQQQLSYTEIKAAYSGVVSARHVEVGEAVQPGMPLMSGFDPARLRVYTDLPQRIARMSAQAPKVRVLLDQDSVIEPLNVVFFPISDSATGTVRARLELPADLQFAYPGQLVKVAVQTGEKERLLIPAEAVVHRSEVAAVYVLNDAQPQLRQVRLGKHLGDRVEVLAGLSAGEKVAYDPIAAGIQLANPRIPAGE